MNRLLGRLAGLLLSLTVVGCATSYGPRGMTGGYKERQVDENTYIVSFFGNGNTSGQQVWNYWIYRCAELTLEKGYDYFLLQPSQEHALQEDGQGRRLQQFSMLDTPVPLAAGSPNMRPVQYYFHYYTVTTYSSKATVKMYKNPLLRYPGFLLDARTIKGMLDPYVTSKAGTVPPERKDLFVRAAVEAAIRSSQIQQAEADALEKKLRESY